MAGLEFENLNPLAKLEFLEGASPEELKAQLLQIRSPINLVAITAAGTKHYAWFLTQDKIKKVTKGIKNG